MPRPASTVWAALLRGVNVGGSKVVKMADLREALEAAGLEKVSTYLQSGNVVFRARQADEAAVRRRIETVIREAFGFDVDCFLRTPDELDAVVDDNPFAGRDLPEIKRLAVEFFHKPAGEALQRFADEDVGPEELVPRGRDLYVYFAEGMGRSKLPRRMAKLQLHGTVRNWNTIRKLRDAAMALQDSACRSKAITTS